MLGNEGSVRTVVGVRLKDFLLYKAFANFVYSGFAYVFSIIQIKWKSFFFLNGDT